MMSQLEIVWHSYKLWELITHNSQFQRCAVARQETHLRRLLCRLLSRYLNSQKPVHSLTRLVHHLSKTWRQAAKIVSTIFRRLELKRFKINPNVIVIDFCRSMNGSP